MRLVCCPACAGRSCFSKVRGEERYRCVRCDVIFEIVTEEL